MLIYRGFYSKKQESVLGNHIIYNVRGENYIITEIKSTDNESGFDDAVLQFVCNADEMKFVRVVRTKEYKQFEVW